MSVKNENAAGNESVVLERPAAGGVYASLFEKINLNPVSELSALDIWQDAQAMGKVPVINLFTLEADPLTITGLESEYLLRPKRLQDGHTEIYAVDSVTGSNRTRDAEYVPFSSFRHKGGMMRRHAPPRYYHTRVKRGITGLYDTWLILGGHQWEDDRLFEREAVSLQITGTNGQLPRRALQSTLLDRCEQVVDTQLTVHNLCKPTLPVLDNMQRILSSRAGTLAHLPDYGLPDMAKILQGMPGTAHELMGTLSAVLLKYEPRLKKITVVLLEQDVPGEMRYAIDAELKGVGLVRYGTEFMPEGRVLLRHLKQQHYLDTTTRL